MHKLFNNINVRQSYNKGFSIVETLVAIIVILITVAGITAAATWALKINAYNNQKSVSQDAVRDIISKKIKTQTFNSLTPYTVAPTSGTAITTTLYDSTGANITGTLATDASLAKTFADIKANLGAAKVEKIITPMLVGPSVYSQYIINIKIKVSWGKNLVNTTELSTVVSDSQNTIAKVLQFPKMTDAVDCGGVGSACCSSGAACKTGFVCNINTGLCTTKCDAVGDTCCAGNICTGSGLTCDTTNHLCKTAGTCGTATMPCCTGNLCNTGLVCNIAQNKCEIATVCGAASQSCCAAYTCDAGLTCDLSTNKCQTASSCGKLTQDCCSGNTCDTGLLCSIITHKCIGISNCGNAVGDACCTPSNTCSTGLTCNITSGKCEPESCGFLNQTCCSTGTDCNTGLLCSSNKCITCGGNGNPCCKGNTCNSGFSCNSSTLKCESTCGDANGQVCCSGNVCNLPSNKTTCNAGVCVSCGQSNGQICCAGNACDSGLKCNLATGNCGTCGGNGNVCCTGNTCNTGFVCSGTTCAVCGAQGNTCCSGSTCNSGLACGNSSNIGNPPQTGNIGKCCLAAGQASGGNGSLCCSGKDQGSPKTCS
jgi:hypothetical protein